MKLVQKIRWAMLTGCILLLAFGIFTKQHLAPDQTIKAAAALIALVALVFWGNAGKNRTVWNASFCFLAGAIALSYSIQSGIFSFNTQFYGFLFLSSLVILVTRINRRKPRSGKKDSMREDAALHSEAVKGDVEGGWRSSQ